MLWAEAKGKSRKEKKRFGTFTHDLLQLADWLEQCGVTHVAMESTGVYWKPVPKEVFELFGIRSIDADTVSLLITASPVIYVNRDMPPFLLIHDYRLIFRAVAIS